MCPNHVSRITTDNPYSTCGLQLQLWRMRQKIRFPHKPNTSAVTPRGSVSNHQIVDLMGYSWMLRLISVDASLCFTWSVCSKSIVRCWLLISSATQLGHELPMVRNGSPDTLHRTPRGARRRAGGLKVLTGGVGDAWDDG